MWRTAGQRPQVPSQGDLAAQTGGTQGLSHDRKGQERSHRSRRNERLEDPPDVKDRSSKPQSLGKGKGAKQGFSKKDQRHAGSTAPQAKRRANPRRRPSHCANRMAPS